MAGKPVICKSGVGGWRDTLRNNYDNDPDMWRRYAETYGLHERLGYDTPEAAWEDNPMIEGSVVPGDFRRAPTE